MDAIFLVLSVVDVFWLCCRDRRYCVDLVDSVVDWQYLYSERASERPVKNQGCPLLRSYRPGITPRTNDGIVICHRCLEVFCGVTKANYC